MQETIASIRECQAQRKAALKMILRISNQPRALIRRRLGWKPDLPEKERNAICKQAEKVMRDIENGDIQGQPETLVFYCKMAATARQPYEYIRNNLEKQMRKQAKSLPVYQWAESINGFGALGLAIIIGECGDLANYSNPAKVWKRMGLAVIGDKAQGKSRENWEEHSYSPIRRSAMWTLGDSLLKKQNAYRELYLERKAMEIERVESKMHAHRRAQRYIEKRLLRDLWTAWRNHGEKGQ